MQRKRVGSLEWLEFDLLADCPRVKHAVFLRSGGYSEGVFASLNTALYVGDRPDHVHANLQLIQKQLEQEVPHWQKMTSGRGTHGKNIAEVTSHSQEEILDCDGLMSASYGISLMMRHADCQIALLYDPQRHVIANIHAGWRGSVLNIYGEAIQKMQHLFGSHPADLLVCIGPSLCPETSEFIHYRTELPEEFWAFQIKPFYFDFWAINESQLRKAGILPHHLEIARISTYTNANDYFSFRRDQKRTGRNATCITLLNC